MTVKKQMYEKSIQYNSTKGLDIMYIADPDNHNKLSRQDIEEGYYEGLSDYFFERYESKISKWEDKADNMTSKVYNPGTHPDKALQIFDKALQYLSDEALPFFKEKEEYYAPEIIDDYNSMVDSIKEDKENFKENEYDEMLIEYNNYIAEKNKLKQIKKEVKAKIKKENIMKRSDLMKCFDKEDAALVRRSLKEFADKDIIEIYKDGSRYMIKFL